MKRKNTLWLTVLYLAVLLLLLFLIAFFIIRLTKNGRNENPSSAASTAAASVVSITEETSSGASSGEEALQSEASSSRDVSSAAESVISSEEATSAEKNTELDGDFSKLLLVNGENPLPDGFDYTDNLVTIPQKYLCGALNQMDKDAFVYAKAMIEAAWQDGVEMYIRSPYRSYDYQTMLYNNEVAKWKNKGYSQADAEDTAATIVARPSTSEHHTGLALDINVADDIFEDSEAYAWLLENAENYGFILRYTGEKQSITGVIHESWHWRFVGIKHAKKINELGYCLEEYVEYLGEN